MKYNGVIQRKFALLDNQIIRLSKHMDGVSYEKFSDDWLLRSMAERALQVMVEIVIDVAERIIAIEDCGPVSSSADAIEKLAELKIIKFSDTYTNMVRFRNLIVHQYEQIDPAVMFDIIRNHLDDFRKFRDEIDTAGSR
jgi:uncharacterized protein YutE (UPF0331/DUF86 family)